MHIIAEAGTNHNGNLEKAKKLATIARNAGAHSVKFQIIYPYGLYLPGDYEYGHYDIKEVLRIRTESMLSDRDYDELADFCGVLGIPFTASVFDLQGLELILKFNPPYIKMASCDLNNVRFLRQVAARGKRVILSTGMSSLSDIETALRTMEKEGNRDLILLHCVSIYPSNTRSSNISFLQALKDFGYPVGYSDHTGDSISACMALACGATWFEKHFTEDRSQKGFDHAYAATPENLKQYVQDLIDARYSLAPKDQKISSEERYTRKRARRSLYAAKAMEAGVVIKDEDVLVVRPENVMDADQIDLVVGKCLNKSIQQYEPFTPEHVA